MATKRQIIKALRDGLKHWDENVDTCPRGDGDHWNWYKENCITTKCALCRIYRRYGCVGCPLNGRFEGGCCKEYAKLRTRARADKNLPIYRNVVAVRDRIKRELEKSK